MRDLTESVKKLGQKIDSFRSGMDINQKHEIRFAIAVHKILDWPGIKELLHNEDVDYVKKAESNRFLPAAPSPVLWAEFSTLMFAKQKANYMKVLHPIYPFLDPLHLGSMTNRVLLSPTQPPERTVESAIVLLVQALESTYSLTQANSHPMLTPLSPAITPSLDHSTPEGKYSLHTGSEANVPGLALYAYASSILGDLKGGSGLLHVQAYLLAALYTGQCMYAYASHAWIHEASRACQILIEQ
jgi:hypothetical protein